MVSDGLHSRSGVSETVRMMSYDENKAKRTPQWTQKPKTCFRGLRFGCLTVESVLYRYMLRIRMVRISDLYALPPQIFSGPQNASTCQRKRLRAMCIPYCGGKARRSSLSTFPVVFLNSYFENLASVVLFGRGTERFKLNESI